MYYYSAPDIGRVAVVESAAGTVATHFGTDGTPNGYSSKLVAVIGIYLFCLAVHVFCALVTSVDPKGKNISPKVYRLILCICPLVSIYAEPLFMVMHLTIRA